VATPIIADTASANSVQLTNASILAITRPLDVLVYGVAIDPQLRQYHGLEHVKVRYLTIVKLSAKSPMA
jgi:hypothetical protein